MGFAVRMWIYMHASCMATRSVFNDHKSLKYLYYHKELNMRQRRWVETLKDLLFYPIMSCEEGKCGRQHFEVSDCVVKTGDGFEMFYMWLISFDDQVCFLS